MSHCEHHTKYTTLFLSEDSDVMAQYCNGCRVKEKAASGVIEIFKFIDVGRPPSPPKAGLKSPWQKFLITSSTLNCASVTGIPLTALTYSLGLIPSASRVPQDAFFKNDEPGLAQGFLPAAYNPLRLVSFEIHRSSTTMAIRHEALLPCILNVRVMQRTRWRM
jgi:hypothetical protein